MKLYLAITLGMWMLGFAKCAKDEDVAPALLALGLAVWAGWLLV